jgi:alcohol dehydrogenase (NADP+)
LQIYNQQKPLRNLCAKHNISVTAYSTLGSSGLLSKINNTKVKPLEHPVVQKIVKSHQKSSGQVLLRHAIQSGLLVIPKSIKPDRIKENFNIFDFLLTEEEMEELNKIDIGDAGRNFNFLSFKGLVYFKKIKFKFHMNKDFQLKVTKFKFICKHILFKI